MPIQPFSLTFSGCTRCGPGRKLCVHFLTICLGVTLCENCVREMNEMIESAKAPKMSAGTYQIRRARKERRCTEASWHTIHAGDLYLYASAPPWADWNTTGKWYVTAYCLRCAERHGMHNSETRTQLEARQNHDSQKA